MKKPRYSITVSIPAFNEEKTLRQVAIEVINEIRKITSDYQLLLVDDGSVDNTGKIMDYLTKKDKRINVIHHKLNQGFSGAIASSLKNGSKELVFLGPADGQFKYSSLSKFVKAINGVDVVLGYRVKNSENLARKIQSKIFHLLCRIFLGLNFKEITTVSLWRKKVLDEVIIRVDPKSNMALADFIYQAKQKRFKFGEVPINWYHRQGGVSKGKINPLLIFSTFSEMLNLFFKIRVKGNT